MGGERLGYLLPDSLHSLPISWEVTGALGGPLPCSITRSHRPASSLLAQQTCCLLCLFVFTRLFPRVENGFAKTEVRPGDRLLLSAPSLGSPQRECVRLKVVSPPDSHVEILTLQVMVSEGGASGGQQVMRVEPR